MEVGMNRLDEKDEKGIKISERLRSNVYPDSEEKLEEDIQTRSESEKDDGTIVDSDHPENQEWPSRENTQEKSRLH